MKRMTSFRAQFYSNQLKCNFQDHTRCSNLTQIRLKRLMIQFSQANERFPTNSDCLEKRPDLPQRVQCIRSCSRCLCPIYRTQSGPDFLTTEQTNKVCFATPEHFTNCVSKNPGFEREINGSDYLLGIFEFSGLPMLPFFSPKRVLFSLASNLFSNIIGCVKFLAVKSWKTRKNFGLPLSFLLG